MIILATILYSRIALPSCASSDACMYKRVGLNWDSCALEHSYMKNNCILRHASVIVGAHAQAPKIGKHLHIEASV